MYSNGGAAGTLADNALKFDTFANVAAFVAAPPPITRVVVGTVVVAETGTAAAELEGVGSNELP